MKKIPAFVRGMVVRAVEESCRKGGLDRVTVEELERIRARMPTRRCLGSAGFSSDQNSKRAASWILRGSDTVPFHVPKSGLSDSVLNAAFPHRTPYVEHVPVPEVEDLDPELEVRAPSLRVS